MKLEINYRALLDERLRRSPAGWMDARTTLRHFALITYAVAPERLAKLIPAGDFEVARFQTQSGEKALFSAVAFLDVDFRFPRLAPGIKFCFYQTNHRAYVIEKATRQPVVWFSEPIWGRGWFICRARFGRFPGIIQTTRWTAGLIQTRVATKSIPTTLIQTGVGVK